MSEQLQFQLTPASSGLGRHGRSRGVAGRGTGAASSEAVPASVPRDSSAASRDASGTLCKRETSGGPAADHGATTEPASRGGIGEGVAAAHRISRTTDPRTSREAGEAMVRSGRRTAQQDAAVFLVGLYPAMTAKELAHLSMPHHDCICLGDTWTDRYYALARRLPECPQLEAHDTGSRARVWRMRETT